MPIYDYECQNCGYTFEIQHSMFIEPLTLCEKCHNDTLMRIISGGLYSSVRKSDDEITLGHLADRNTSRFSDDKKEMLNEKHGRSKADKYKKQPQIEFGNPNVTPQQINSMTPKQKQHYILTGETP